MALIEHDLFRGRIDKVQMAIDRLKAFEPAEGYYLAYSGGKDSDVILELAKMAGVRFDAHHQLTTVDAPETVYHVRKHPEVQIHRPDMTMWQLIVKKKMPPLRMRRYCCEVLKERGGTGRVVMTGVRRAEGANNGQRRHRQMVETCYKDTTKRYMNPIVDWTTEEVWKFIAMAGVTVNPLYAEGWKRVGCVMCPISDNAAREAARWPKIARAYLRAFHKIPFDPSKSRFKDADEWFAWWLYGSKGTTKNEPMLFD